MARGERASGSPASESILSTSTRDLSRRVSASRTACSRTPGAASPNPTGALSVADAVPGVRNLINLSACPANVENLTALLVYFLTF